MEIQAYKMPASVDLAVAPVYRQLNLASRALAEFKGMTAMIPNAAILAGSLPWREAKASSALANIEAGYEQILCCGPQPGNAASPQVRQVVLCRQALLYGYKMMRGRRMFIGADTMLAIFRLLGHSPAETDAGSMKKLIAFINQERGLDPLIKMAIIHHWLASTAAGDDGRMARIASLLYLVGRGLLDYPVLGLSLPIVASRHDYHRLLDETIRKGAWQEWVIYMLRMVADAARDDAALLAAIHQQSQAVRRQMRRQLPKIYSRDLAEFVFCHPYARIEHLARALDVGRQTATKYLNALAERGFVGKRKIGRNQYFINERLLEAMVGRQDL